MTLGGAYPGEAYPGGEPASTSTVAGTAAGSLGGMAGAAVVSHAGTAAGVLGGIAGSAGSFRAIGGTATGSLGGVTGAASGVRTAPGTSAGSLGSISGSASGVVTVPGTANGSLGRIAGTSTGNVTIVVHLPLLDFIDYEVLAPAAVVTPVLIGADHIEWGFGVHEGEAQGGGGPIDRGVAAVVGGSLGALIGAAA